jgi:hypothetical protein
LGSFASGGSSRLWFNQIQGWTEHPFRIRTILLNVRTVPKNKVYKLYVPETEPWTYTFSPITWIITHKKAKAGHTRWIIHCNPPTISRRIEEKKPTSAQNRDLTEKCLKFSAFWHREIDRLSKAHKIHVGLQRPYLAYIIWDRNKFWTCIDHGSAQTNGRQKQSSSVEFSTDDMPL